MPLGGQPIAVYGWTVGLIACLALSPAIEEIQIHGARPWATLRCHWWWDRPRHRIPPAFGELDRHHHHRHHLDVHVRGVRNTGSVLNLDRATIVRVSGQVPCDVLLMALDRPATDLEQLGVSPEPFDHVLET